MTCIIMSCEERIENTNNVEIQHIMDGLDDGLNKIKLNDSTTILIYRGMQSCTMIQLK